MSTTTLSEETIKSLQIRYPKAFEPLLEDLRKLESDGCNPNKMTVKQKETLWGSLKKYGWVDPILANKDGVFADGEQRVSVCISHEEFYGPVLRLPVSEVDRRLLRQIKNKLRGRHDKKQDIEEYLKIVQAGEEEELKQLLKAVGEPIPDFMQPPPREKVGAIPEIYEIIIECKDEEEQQREFEKLQEQGYKCRVLIL